MDQIVLNGLRIRFSLKHPLIPSRLSEWDGKLTLYLPHRKEIVNVVRMHHHNAVAQDLC
jgi:hypothetical protein